jgi:hypothetical protein
MRTVLRLISLGAILLFGCNAPPPPPPPSGALPISLVLNLKQFMEWVLDPAADAIWDSVKTVYTQTGTQDIKPQSNEQWAELGNAATRLKGAGNMLMNEERMRDNRDWSNRAGRLIAAAEKVRMAVEAKNVEALFDAGGELYQSCSACHTRFAPHLSSSRSTDRVALAIAKGPPAHP